MSLLLSFIGANYSVAVFEDGPARLTSLPDRAAVARRAFRSGLSRAIAAAVTLFASALLLVLAVYGPAAAAVPGAGGSARAWAAVAEEGGSDPAALERTHITIALLPNGIGVRALERVPEIAPGLMSAGLGRVLPDQTYLDISQGARAFNSLYDTPLPLVLPQGERVPHWRQIVARAETAPGAIIPGLFASYLNLNLNVRSRGGAGVPAVVSEPELVVPALLGVDRFGRTRRYERASCTARECRPAVIVRNARLRELPELIEDLVGRDLLIAIERPPPEDGGMLTIGLAGAGYHGNLTSATTRTSGYVLATDIAPTVIDRLGLEPPPQMTGRPIRAEGSRDIGALISLERRMVVVAPRRGPVMGLAVLVWLAATMAALAVDRVLRWRRRRPTGATATAAPATAEDRPLRRFALALRLLALSAIFLPTVLLAGAAVRPEQSVEQLLTVLGPPLLGAIALAIAPGWRAVAVACGVTVVAHAVDVVSGSPLISLSLIGPNPGLGVRFYGIGNELGATLSVLIMIGIGAGLAGFAPRLDRRAAALAFLAASLPLAAIFAAGRFGADVGSAMVIPAAAVVAAAVVLRRRLLAIAALAVPLAGLALLVAVDLISGGDSHFQRTVLDARGGDLIDTIARRLRLTGRSFVRGASGPFLPLTAVLIGIAIVYRARIASWVGAAPRAMRAGIAGAAFATLLGTAVNDSGVLLLEVGTAYLLLTIGYAWAEAGQRGRSRRDATAAPDRADSPETGVSVLGAENAL